MATLTVVRGDAINLPTTLTLNGEPHAISLDATVRAALVTSNDINRSLLGTVTAMSNAAAGADWPSGVVMLIFPKTETAAWKPGNHMIEIEVDDGGPLTWFTPIVVKRGAIP